MKNIAQIELGRHVMDTWYFSPFPPEYKDCKVSHATLCMQSRWLARAGCSLLLCFSSHVILCPTSFHIGQPIFLASCAKVVAQLSYVSHALAMHSAPAPQHIWKQCGESGQGFQQ